MTPGLINYYTYRSKYIHLCLLAVGHIGAKSIDP